MHLREPIAGAIGDHTLPLAPSTASVQSTGLSQNRRVRCAAGLTLGDCVRRAIGVAVFLLIGGGATPGFSAIPAPIATISPTQNEFAVPCTASIVISFSEDIDPSTVSSTTLFVSSGLAGRLSGVYSYDGSSHSANFKPHSAFTAGDMVSVTVTKKLLTALGDSLEYPFVWQFTVAAKSGLNSLQEASLLAIGGQLKRLAVGDIDSNGAPDIVVSRFDLEDVRIAVSAGCDGYVLQPQTLSGFNDPYAVTCGDFNGDGWPDMAVANSATGGVPMEHLVSVAINNVGSFGIPLEFHAGLAPRLLRSGDVNGDGHEDIVTCNLLGATASLLNDGSGTFSPLPFVSGPNDPLTLRLADVDNDGDLDAIVAGATIGIRANNGAGQFSALGDYDNGASPRHVAAGDINGDGFVDVVATRIATSELVAMLNDGTGSLDTTLLSPMTLGGDPVGIELADLDGDGDLDVALAKRNPSVVAIFLNDSHGGLSSAGDLPVGSEPVAIQAKDLSRDGSVGIAVATQTGNLVYWGWGICPFQTDHNVDGFIDATDLAIEIDIVYFGATDTQDLGCPMTRADFNSDGFADSVDLALLIDHVFFGGSGPYDPCQI